MLRRGFLWAVALCILLALPGCAPRRRPAPAAFMKGFNYVAYASDVLASPRSDRVLRELRRTGADWVAITPVWYQDDAASTDIAPWEGRSADDDSLRHAVDTARRLGFHVALKPVVDVKDGTWRALIAPSDWGRWFAAYRRFLDHYARLAREQGVELLVVGSQMSSAEPLAKEWRTLIAETRRAFPGRLTYAADWSRYRDVPFWRDLDFVGINAFFPLSDKARPALDELRRGWDRRRREIETWLDASKVGKPVLFTEIGYMSRRGAAADPARYVPGAPVDLALQRDAYRAALESAARSPWLAGMFWFWWDNPSVPDWPGGRRDPGFTPRGKPAQEEVRRWFRRAWPAAARP